MFWFTKKKEKEISEPITGVIYALGRMDKRFTVELQGKTERHEAYKIEDKGNGFIIALRIKNLGWMGKEFLGYTIPPIDITKDELEALYVAAVTAYEGSIDNSLRRNRLGLANYY